MDNSKSFILYSNTQRENRNEGEEDPSENIERDMDKASTNEGYITVATG